MPKNMANYLTIGRVLMIPVFRVLMYVDFPGSRYWALAVYLVACLTDFADGYRPALSPGFRFRQIHGSAGG